MQRTGAVILVGILVAMLSGCGRPPTAPEGSAKKKPAPVHTRTVSF